MCVCASLYVKASKGLDRFTKEVPYFIPDFDSDTYHLGTSNLNFILTMQWSDQQLALRLL